MSEVVVGAVAMKTTAISQLCGQRCAGGPPLALDPLMTVGVARDHARVVGANAVPLKSHIPEKRVTTSPLSPMIANMESVSGPAASFIAVGFVSKHAGMTWMQSALRGVSGDQTEAGQPHYTRWSFLFPSGHHEMSGLLFLETQSCLRSGPLNTRVHRIRMAPLTCG